MSKVPAYIDSFFSEDVVESILKGGGLKDRTDFKPGFAEDYSDEEIQELATMWTQPQNKSPWLPLVYFKSKCWHSDNGHCTMDWLEKTEALKATFQKEVTPRIRHSRDQFKRLGWMKALRKSTPS
jgi:hypothetical protein